MRKAADLATRAGADVIMTGTGRVQPVATTPVTLAMLCQIPCQDWLTPDTFRFGASRLADDILMQLRKEMTGVYQSGDYFSKD